VTLEIRGEHLEQVPHGERSGVSVVGSSERCFDCGGPRVGRDPAPHAHVDRPSIPSRYRR